MEVEYILIVIKQLGNMHCYSTAFIVFDNNLSIEKIVDGTIKTNNATELSFNTELYIILNIILFKVLFLENRMHLN